MPPPLFLHLSVQQTCSKLRPSGAGAVTLDTVRDGHIFGSRTVADLDKWVMGSWNISLCS